MIQNFQKKVTGGIAQGEGNTWQIVKVIVKTQINII